MEALSANLIDKKEYETIHTFFDKIHKATIDGEEFVETSDEIIKHYNKNGLGPNANYFIFQGIKVCPFGQLESIREELERPLALIIHGDTEGTEAVVKAVNKRKIVNTPKVEVKTRGRPPKV